MKILVSKIKIILCIDPIMSAPLNDTPDIYIEDEDVYNSCTQGQRLINYPGFQLEIPILLNDAAIYIDTEFFRHILEIWRIKSERPFPGSWDNSDLWFFYPSYYLDPNPEWEHGWDGNKFRKIFGYDRDTEDKMETVKFDQFNKNCSDADHCVLLMTNRCIGKLMLSCTQNCYLFFTTNLRVHSPR